MENSVYHPCMVLDKIMNKEIKNGKFGNFIYGNYGKPNLFFHFNKKQISVE